MPDFFFTDFRVGSHSGTVTTMATAELGVAFGADAPRAATCVRPSFERVYEAHFDFVWRSTRRLGVADYAVDDVVQEVFLVVHRQLAKFEGRSAVKTWLYGITRRVVSDHRRKARRRGHHEPIPETIAAGGSSPHERAEKNEAARLLHAILDSMPDDKREVFVLAELEQMSAPEIAEVLGANLNTVYSRIRKARKVFEAALARHQARGARRSA